MAETQNLLARERGLAGDTEELIEHSAEQSASRIVAAREQTRAAVSRARAEFAGLAQAGSARVRAAGQAGQKYVRAHPWQMIAGAAIIVALIASALLARRSEQ